MTGTRIVGAAIALPMAMLLGALVLTFSLSAAPTLAANSEAGSGPAVSIGSIMVERGWTRQVPPGARAGGGYASIVNTGNEPDRLLGGSAAFAKRVEIHDMNVTDGVMRMEKLPDGLPIAAGERVTLEPGGLHLMFVGIEKPPKEGDAVSVTLEFERAGSVTVELPVAAIGARSPHGSNKDGAHQAGNHDMNGHGMNGHGDMGVGPAHRSSGDGSEGMASGD